ncbi:hypothetical protein RJT34_14121 [Clitoria ternatea]|uniref:CASP-like protein n=1 Tax=Clitoria ternatea TaxID=43366 RepID=A0AAN9JTA8_CLITE
MVVGKDEGDDGAIVVSDLEEEAMRKRAPEQPQTRSHVPSSSSLAATDATISDGSLTAKLIFKSDPQTKPLILTLFVVSSMIKTKRVLTLFLRFLAFGATIAAVIVMVTSHDSAEVLNLTFIAKYNNEQVFKYFLIAEAIAYVYSLILLFICSQISLWRLVLILGVVIAMLLSTSVSEALAIAHLGKKGNSHAGKEREEKVDVKFPQPGKLGQHVDDGGINDFCAEVDEIGVVMVNEADEFVVDEFVVEGGEVVVVVDLGTETIEGNQGSVERVSGSHRRRFEVQWNAMDGTVKGERRGGYHRAWGLGFGGAIPTLRR